jgi:hypothetical protein
MMALLPRIAQARLTSAEFYLVPAPNSPVPKWDTLDFWLACSRLFQNKDGRM